MNKTISQTKHFFPALTGSRAIATWMIFIYHFFPFKNINHSYSLSSTLYLSFYSNT